MGGPPANCIAAPASSFALPFSPLCLHLMQAGGTQKLAVLWFGGVGFGVNEAIPTSSVWDYVVLRMNVANECGKRTAKSTDFSHRT